MNKKKIIFVGLVVGCFFMMHARVSIKGAWKKTKEKVSAGAQAAGRGIKDTARKAAKAAGLDEVMVTEFGQALGEGIEVIGKGAKKIGGVVGKPVHKAYHTVSDPLAQRLIEPFVKFKQSPHYQEGALVRVSSDIPQEEKAYLEKRDIVTQDALEKFLGISLGATNIRIAVSGSGGGYRAMQLSLGSLIGMEKNWFF